MRGTALLAACLLLASCAPRPRTQVMVLVSADPSVTARAVRLDVDVLGGPALDEVREDGGLGSASQPVSFPVRVALVPEDGDVGRRFRLELAALDASGATLARHRVISGFVQGQTLALPVFLEACCASTACDDTQTCRDCACTDAAIDPRDLQPLSHDAGAPDAPQPDAGPVDAWTSDDAAIASLDAAGCAPGTSCFVVDGFSAMAYVASRDGAWAPPLACGGPLAATRDHGYGWFVLYNERPVAYDLHLETQRWGAESASYDLMLVVYAIDSPTERDLAATTRPADCLVMADGGGAVPPDAGLDVTLPAHGSLLVVITTPVPGDISADGVQTAMSYR